MQGHDGFITVTGADESTDIDALCELDAEIGLLYSATPEGRKRYPSWDWLVSAAKRISRLSVHICGSTARQQLANVQLEALISRAQRIQVNGRLTKAEVETLCGLYPGHTIITQHHPSNVDLTAIDFANHALLQDSSGGRGLAARDWLPSPADKPFGYAGGLGPENLAAELVRIRMVAKDGWWCDMEASLRINDVFSVDRARAAIDIFHAGGRGGLGVRFDRTKQQVMR